MPSLCTKLEQIDEFVLVAVPVTLARPVARRQAHEVDAEILDPASIAQPLTYAVDAGRIELRRIARPFAFGYRSDVDLGHWRPSSDPASKVT